METTGLEGVFEESSSAMSRILDVLFPRRVWRREYWAEECDRAPYDDDGVGRHDAEEWISLDPNCASGVLEGFACKWCGKPVP